MAAVCACFSGFKRREIVVLFRIAPLEHHGERHSEVGCRRNRAPIEGHRLSRDASGSSKETTQRRPSKCATTVTL